MTFRSVSILTLLVAVVALTAWLWRGKNKSQPTIPAREVVSPTPGAPARSPAEPKGATSSVAPGTPLVRTVSPAPGTTVAALPPAADSPRSRPELQAEGRADLEAVQFMLRDFRTRMGENPVGSNAEIMRAVMGGNSANARLGPPAGQSLSADGELLDRWGTPYFFHQLSKLSTEIRSAGPDRRLWTADDLVTK